MTDTAKQKGPIYCIGAANVDRKYYLLSDLVEQTSNPVVSSSSIGGVARNIAENLGRLNLPAHLITMSGKDNEWQMIKDHTEMFVDLSSSIQRPDLRTGTYTAVIDQEGEMTHGFADMEVYAHLTREVLGSLTERLKEASCLVLDLNLHKDSVSFLIDFAQTHRIPIAIVTVSQSKMQHLPEKLDGLDWLMTNRDESLAYFNIEDEHCTDQVLIDKWLARGVKRVVMTNGAKTIGYGSADTYKVFEVEPSQKVVDVTGAGDAFSASLIFAWLSGYTLDQSITLALANSKATIESPDTVRSNLTRELLIQSLNT